VHAQQVIGARVEERRVDVAGLFNVLLGEDRRASRDAANDWQAGVVGLGFEAGNANTARSSRRGVASALAY
jgi:hypothetical protein